MIAKPGHETNLQLDIIIMVLTLVIKHKMVFIKTIAEFSHRCSDSC